MLLLRAASLANGLWLLAVYSQRRAQSLLGAEATDPWKVHIPPSVLL